MVKIVESTGFIGIRIQKIISALGYGESQLEDGKRIEGSNLQYHFKDVDLLIVDLDNRYTDVEALIRNLKADQLLSSIPIIVLGNNANFAALKKVFQLGCSDFVIMPFSDKTLQNKVMKWMGNRAVDIVENNQAKEEQHNIKLVWCEAFETGIKEIDDDHKSIVDHFAMLYELMKKGEGHAYYGELIEFLNKYIHEHFENEEKIQKDIGYPDLQQHHQLHEQFKKKLVNIIETYENKEITDFDLISIGIFLRDWLIKHILVEDHKIGRYIK